jgi:hypothetical protein
MCGAGAGVLMRATCRARAGLSRRQSWGASNRHGAQLKFTSKTSPYGRTEEAILCCLCIKSWRPSSPLQRSDFIFCRPGQCNVPNDSNSIHIKTLPRSRGANQRSLQSAEKNTILRIIRKISSGLSINALRTVRTSAPPNSRHGSQPRCRNTNPRPYYSPSLRQITEVPKQHSL